MTERYQGRAEDIAAPARRGFAITASDVADLAAETRAVYIGSGGDLAVVLSSGDEVSFAGLTGGSLLPIRARRIKSTGTTATFLVGLY
ncbi:hypothetical protein PRN20_10065 [Devosia sp. ZB163]|uniref:spike base protein, RCAP_Rcc01079 family n=1 Tax=Devosia sp. ZB163 TaxID=3025938 RepID=UPI00235E0476|nr:hypothetical protein [Devosia sp. ZB163]MDC9824082.1 hypothetical protein [Devosia sp. ZB163]